MRVIWIARVAESEYIAAAMTLFCRSLTAIILLVPAVGWSQQGDKISQGVAVSGRTGQPSAVQVPSASNSSTFTMPGDSESLVLEMDGRWPDASRVGLQGRVVLLVSVSETGNVETVDVISGQPAPAQTAVKQAKQFKFKPYIRSGRAIKVQTKIPVDVYSGGKVVVAEDETTRLVPFEHETLGTFLNEKVLKRVAPVYPPEAKKAGIQGDVIIYAVIGKDGHPYNLRALGGPEALQPAAIQAVEQWVFQPHMWKGESIEVGTQVVVNFSLALHLLKHVDPIYPPDARESGIQGRVVVYAMIGKDGHPYNLRALSGPQELKAAAIEAVQQWVFQPRIVHGEPVEEAIRANVDFNLGSRPTPSASENRRAIYTIP